MTNEEKRFLFYGSKKKEMSPIEIMEEVEKQSELLCKEKKTKVFIVTNEYRREIMIVNRFLSLLFKCYPLRKISLVIDKEYLAKICTINVTTSDGQTLTTDGEHLSEALLLLEYELNIKQQMEDTNAEL